MTKVDRHLVVVLALVIITGATSIWVDHRRPESSATPVASPAAAVAPVTGWAVADRVPGDVLPDDLRALEAVRQTYTDGSRTVWLVRAVYKTTSGPETRPSIDALVSRQGALAVEYGQMELRETTLGGRRHVSSVRVRRGSNDITTVYWYRLGDDVVTGEYELRWRLFVDTLLGRTRVLTLTRVASDTTETLQSFIASPQLVQAR
jgi:hypothetical protein